MSEEDYKYCPECNTEYYSHIENCADCSVPLVTQSKMEELKHNKRNVSGNASSEPVAVREGDKSWIQEVYNHLETKGFTAKITCSPDCSPGRCGETFQIVVPSEDAEEAAQCIEEYNHEAHPELKESYNNSSEGKCPACGHDVGFEATECSDCGLMLLIEEEE